MSIPIWNLFFMITLQLKFQSDLWSNILGRICGLDSFRCRFGLADQASMSLTLASHLEWGLRIWSLSLFLECRVHFNFMSVWITRLSFIVHLVWMKDSEAFRDPKDSDCAKNIKQLRDLFGSVKFLSSDSDRFLRVSIQNRRVGLRKF